MDAIKEIIEVVEGLVQSYGLVVILMGFALGMIWRTWRKDREEWRTDLGKAWEKVDKLSSAVTRLAEAIRP